VRQDAIWNGAIWLVDGWLWISLLGLEMQMVPMVAQMVVDGGIRPDNTLHNHRGIHNACCDNAKHGISFTIWGWISRHGSTSTFEGTGKANAR